MPAASYLSVFVPLSALVSYTVLAFLVVRRRSLSRIHITFALYLFSMIIWSGASMMIRVDSGNARFWSKLVTAGGATLMPLAWFAFVQAFLGENPANRRLLPGIFTAVVVTLATSMGYMVEDVIVDPIAKLVQVEYGPGVILYGIHWITYLTWSALILARAYDRADEPAWRNRIRYPLIGLGFVMVGAVTNAVPSLGQYPLDIAANLANAFLLAYTIARYQLIDIALVLRRTLSWLIGVGLIGTAYGMSLFLLQSVFTNRSTGLIILSLVVSLAVLGLSPGLRHWIQKAVDRLISRESYNLHLMLEDVSRGVTRLRPLPELGNLILKRVVTTMALEHGVMLAEQEGTERFVVISGVGLEVDLTTIQWRNDHPMVVYFTNGDRPLLGGQMDLLPLLRSLWASESAELSLLHGELYVPVRTHGRLLAVLVFGGKLNGQPFSVDDVSALSTLANQTAIAIDNAWLYQEVRSEANKLARANVELRRLDKMKDEFIQNISHELRTPLMLVRGYIELMYKGALGPVTPPQHSALQTVLQRADSIIDMVNEIIALTKNESESVTLEPLDIRPVVTGCVDAALGAAQGAGVKLALSCPGDVPLVSGDGRRLRQVFDNLIGNAIKFSPDGGEVLVKVEYRGAVVRVGVSDQGIGIAPDALSHIWERFYQADASSSRRFAGSGLGLTIVKRIVEAHGGEVGVTSKLGQGSTFTFTLRAHQSTVDQTL